MYLRKRKITVSQLNLVKILPLLAGFQLYQGMESKFNKIIFLIKIIISSYLIKGFNIASLAVISSVGTNYLINKSHEKKGSAAIHEKIGEV